MRLDRWWKVALITLIFLFVFTYGKHLVDTDFFKHPSTDLLDWWR
jgi:hypothetical protein